MTTAHRPTYHPAIGRVHQGGYRYDVARAQFSSREMPAHMTLKSRQDLNSKAQDQQALKQALFGREQKHKQGSTEEQSRQVILPDSASSSSSSALASSAAAPASPASPFAPDDDAAEGEGRGSSSPPPQPDLSQFDDEDDDIAVVRKNHSEDEDDDSDDSDDEDAELARELELIRREREQAKIKAAQAEAAAAESAALQQLNSNPLLPSLGGTSAAAAGSVGVKRRWDDDVVFKNQASGDRGAGAAQKKRFINDVIRSDFHRSFLKRYVK